MRLKKIAIADPPTKRRGYGDYYLIAVFDIRIAINARGSNDRGWRMLAATDLYPYTFKDAVRHLGRIFAVTSQGTCFIWLPSYGTGDYKHNAQTIICIPNRPNSSKFDLAIGIAPSLLSNSINVAL